eukprot:6485945-Pyramimonas_sp.AAC.1
MVDAWNAEAFLGTLEAARQDWIDWRVPAARNHLAMTTIMRWDQCSSAAIEICNGARCSGGIARYNSQQRLAALLARNP